MQRAKLIIAPASKIGRACVQVALLAVEIEEHEGGRARDAGRASDGEKAEKPCAATVSGLRPIAPAGGVSAGAARSAGDITQFRHNQAEVCRLGRDVSAVCARMIACETWFGLRGSPGVTKRETAMWRGLSLGGFLAAAVAGIGFANGASAATIDKFSPQGEVRAVRQVAVRFSEDIVKFGDPGVKNSAATPFTIECTEPGQGRWLDSRAWVFDFNRDLPPGIRCSLDRRAHV